MCTDKPMRARRARFSAKFDFSGFLQFVRDITRDHTVGPKTAAPGTRLYNYLEGDGKLRYWPMHRYRIQCVLRRKRLAGCRVKRSPLGQSMYSIVQVGNIPGEHGLFSPCTRVARVLRRAERRS